MNIYQSIPESEVRRKFVLWEQDFILYNPVSMGNLQIKLVADDLSICSQSIVNTINQDVTFKPYSNWLTEGRFLVKSVASLPGERKK